jgi:haloacetate dehalogenase
MRAEFCDARCSSSGRKGDDMADLYGDPIAVWRQWADNVTGISIDSGHHMAEEAPHDLADHLIRFVETPA